MTREEQIHLNSPNRNNRKYILTLDEQQYQDVITAVETFHRIICGQVEEINLTGLFDISDETLRQLRTEMFPELPYNTDYGWNGGHPNKYLDRLQASTYQIYREMLHARTVDDSNNDWSVYNIETLTSHKADKPKIEIINLP